jgi:hypothetical protein
MLMRKLCRFLFSHSLASLSFVDRHMATKLKREILYLDSQHVAINPLGINGYIPAKRGRGVIVLTFIR